MSLRREAHKARLMAQGVPEWQADMVANEAELGGMGGVIADARIFANVHGSRSVIPEREPNARERAEADARVRAQAAQEAKWEAAREASCARAAEWNQRR
ncbi:hypothetical protein [Methylocystis sp.]|uniref:hypothetical protein n=1 Tax=Methylocystis sp. TaxID=1911079 RepID=UPI0025E4E294|nr:hypothetical protein [Methylocystis sp.]